MTEIKKLTSVMEFERLQEAAAADDHVLISPTHFFEKDGKPMGYVSILPCSPVHWWMDSKVGNAFDSLRTIKQLEQEAYKQGIRHYQVAVADTSPYHSKMHKMGFSSLGDTTLFRKTINHG